MALLTLNWDNTLVLASANATGQRASKRIKSVGGAFSTLGFNPANDLLKTAVTTDATVDANKVYEFMIQAICISGGPTMNTNGLQEGIVFQCIEPSFDETNTTIDVVVNLAGLDITKIRVRLKKQSDDSLVGTVTANKIGTIATASFSGLTASTDYYVEIELYATVNGVEVISSAAEYLNEVCGGNIDGYQVSTTANPSCPAPLDLEVVTTPL